MRAEDFYSALINTGINIEWAEQQHINFVLKVIDKIITKDEGPRKLTNSELMEYLVD